MDFQRNLGARGVGVALPEAVPLAQYLEPLGLEAEPYLREGFRQLRIGDEPHSIALAAAQAALADAGLSAGAVDGVITFSGAPLPGHQPLGSFLVHALALHRETPVYSLQMQGCATLFSALRLAHQLCLAEGRRNLLLVGADVHRHNLIDLQRLRTTLAEGAITDTTLQPLLNNRFASAWSIPCSDGACALIVGPDSSRRRFLALVQATQGNLWSNSATTSPERLQAGLQLSLLVRRLVQQLKAETRAEPTVYLTNNIGAGGLEVLAQLLQIAPSQLQVGSQAENGHIISCDLVINWWQYQQQNGNRQQSHGIICGAGVGGFAGALLVEL